MWNSVITQSDTLTEGAQPRISHPKVNVPSESTKALCCMAHQFFFTVDYWPPTVDHWPLTIDQRPLTVDQVEPAVQLIAMPPLSSLFTPRTRKVRILLINFSPFRHSCHFCPVATFATFVTNATMIRPEKHILPPSLGQHFCLHPQPMTHPLSPPPYIPWLHSASPHTNLPILPLPVLIATCPSLPSVSLPPVLFCHLSFNAACPLCHHFFWHLSYSPPALFATISFATSPFCHLSFLPHFLSATSPFCHLSSSRLSTSSATATPVHTWGDQNSIYVWPPSECSRWQHRNPRTSYPIYPI